jgi:hypothetical protein
MQMILQLLALSPVFDEVLDFCQLVSTTRFEPAGVMKDKAVSCWILKLMLDVVFSALNNYSECHHWRAHVDVIRTECDGFISESI